MCEEIISAFRPGRVSHLHDIFLPYKLPFMTAHVSESHLASVYILCDGLFVCRSGGCCVSVLTVTRLMSRMSAMNSLLVQCAEVNVKGTSRRDRQKHACTTVLAFSLGLYYL